MIRGGRWCTRNFVFSLKCDDVCTSSVSKKENGNAEFWWLRSVKTTQNMERNNYCSDVTVVD